MEINSTKINTFIFDCFGVICGSAFFSWYKENMLKYGNTDSKLLEVFKEHDLGRFPEEDVAEYFSKYEGIDATKEKILEDFNNYLNIDQRLVDTILKLREKGFKIALISNGHHLYFEDRVYVKYPEFKNLFDEIIVSSLVGTVKPDKEIYLHALSKINSKPEESLFIDDSQVNIDGAKNVGIQGFLYTDVDSFIEYIKSLGIDLEK